MKKDGVTDARVAITMVEAGVAITMIEEMAAWNAEQRLAAAILTRSLLDCLPEYNNHESVSHPEHRAGAKAFFLEEDKDREFSFYWIVRLLDLPMDTANELKKRALGYEKTSEETLENSRFLKKNAKHPQMPDKPE